MTENNNKSNLEEKMNNELKEIRRLQFSGRGCQVLNDEQRKSLFDEEDEVKESNKIVNKTKESSKLQDTSNKP